MNAMNIQNDSLNEIGCLPQEKKTFNWREHISEGDKQDCDRMINEIVKIPENIKAFNEMLKIF